MIKLLKKILGIKSPSKLNTWCDICCHKYDCEEIENFIKSKESTCPWWGSLP